MKYYKINSGEVFAFSDDGSQDEYIRPDMVKMTAPEVLLHENPPITKIELKEKIRGDFYNAIAAPVAGYNGGFDSAIKLDAAKRLAEAAGVASVTFFDANNNANVLTMADAQLIIMQVAADYQTKLTRKQQLFAQIDAATTQAELDVVAW